MTQVIILRFWSTWYTVSAELITHPVTEFPLPENKKISRPDRITKIPAIDSNIPEKNHSCVLCGNPGNRGFTIRHLFDTIAAVHFPWGCLPTWFNCLNPIAVSSAFLLMRCFDIGQAAILVIIFFFIRHIRPPLFIQELLYVRTMPFFALISDI